VLVRALALAALLLAAPGATRPPPPGPPPAEAPDARREVAARRLIRAGLDLRRAIVAGDVNAILALVPPEGLRCAGAVVPRARVERDLRSPRSWLHRTLLGASGPPTSLREFLRRAGDDVAVAVTFEPDDAAGPLGRGCIAYRAPRLAPPVLPLCFVERRGTLWLVESLYPCG
jgi:hypothetical protein